MYGAKIRQCHCLLDYINTDTCCFGACNKKIIMAQDDLDLEFDILLEDILRDEMLQDNGISSTGTSF